MKLTLRREAQLEHWRVIGTLGFGQRRPEIVAILVLAGEQPHAVVTGADVSRSLLAGRPHAVGERLLEVCSMMRLVERTSTPKHGWQLTDLGRRAIESGEVPSPERGEYDLWLLTDLLYPEAIVRVRHAEREPSDSERRPPATQAVPALLHERLAKVAHLPVRLDDDEPTHAIPLAFEPLGRCLGRETCELIVEFAADGGTAKFRVTVNGKQASFAASAQLPSLDDALELASLQELRRPVSVTFRALSDGERRTARRELPVDEVELPGVGRFAGGRLTEVHLLPENQQDADEWAKWRLRDRIRGYVWPQDYESHAGEVRKLAVDERWPFDVAVPTQAELAVACADQPTLARWLAVPPDWAGRRGTQEPTLVLSGRAALAKDGRALAEDHGRDAVRVYVLESGDGGTNDETIARRLGARAVARRVRQPPDVWLRRDGERLRGQRWFDAAKHGAGGQKTASDGEWRDITAAELPKAVEALKSAFWNRPTQELQLDGTWVAVKPAPQ